MTGCEETTRLLDEVRALVLREVEQEPECYDERDVELVRSADWHVQRYLRRKQNHVPEAAKMLLGTMKWRKEWSLPTLQDCDFPQEFYRIGGLFECAQDRQGNRVIYVRIKLHRKIKELERLIKQFIVYTLDKADRAAEGRGIVMVMDCKDAGLINVDMDTLWFIINFFLHHFPYGISYILVLDMPWIFTSFWKIARGWLSEEHREKIKFSPRDQVHQYIERENVPFYLGGLSKVNYHAVPDGCLPGVEFGPRHDLNEKDVKRILSVFESSLEEADQDVRLLTSAITDNHCEVAKNQAITVVA